MAIAVYSLAPLLGPVIGPIAGSWYVCSGSMHPQYTDSIYRVAEKSTWRWVFWSTCIVDAAVQVAGYFLLQESTLPQL